MILDTIAQSARRRVNLAKRKVPLDNLKSQIFCKDKVKRFHRREDFAFEKNIKNQKVSPLYVK